jgi:hypothetical protein
MNSLVKPATNDHDAQPADWMPAVTNVKETDHV